MTAPAYIQLQQWWSQTGSDISTEAIPAPRIESLERRYGLLLPEDLTVPQAIVANRGSLGSRDHDVVALRARTYRTSLVVKWSHSSLNAAASISSSPTTASGVGPGQSGYDKLIAESFSDFIHKYIREARSVC
jgi:hypothetical protein